MLRMLFGIDWFRLLDLCSQAGGTAKLYTTAVCGDLRLAELIESDDNACQSDTAHTIRQTRVELPAHGVRT